MGCPQGRFLSLLMCFFIADALLVKIEETYTVGFADDFVLLVRGFDTSLVFDRMQQALRLVEQFTNSVSLSENPAKVGEKLYKLNLFASLVETFH
jgi:hypothetical protein